MSGRLHARGGILYLLRPRRGWRVELFDWDGRALPGGFRLGPEWGVVRNLTVDEDRRIWIIDAARQLCVAHTLFGMPGESFALRQEHPQAIAVRGLEQEQVRYVAYGGVQRHGLQCWRADAPQRPIQLRSLGRSDAHFEGACALALRGAQELLLAEQFANRVQVFRSLEFHYSLRLDPGRDARLIALAPLADGRIVATFDGEHASLELFDSRGTHLATLAEPGRVLAPCGLAVEEADIDARIRVALLDLAGSRVQIFNLCGTRLGSFYEPGSASVEDDEFHAS
jgi:hypothetical protein